MAALLAAGGPPVDLVLHSPKLRAVQTAEILGRAAPAATEVTPALAEPPGDALLDRLAREERVAIVGHAQWLDELLALLVLGEIRAAGRFDLRKAGAAWLTGEPRPSGMRLRALLTPRLAVAACRIGVRGR
jgi:phosphohistidine phosphatase